MPKVKTHKAAKKRFKKSKNGKIFHGKSNYFHKNLSKRSNTRRKGRQDKELCGGQAKTIKRMLGS